jgi:UDP-N-acetylmuramate dehydrogenase
MTVNNWEKLMADFAADFVGKSLGGVSRDVPMTAYTSWQIGGAADWLVEPNCAEGVLATLDFCAENEIPLTIIGRGTNLLVSDNGIAGVVLRIGEQMSEITYLENNCVHAEAGALLRILSLESAKRGLTGLEWACGIPGNMGGALMMNAGAYGSCIGDFVTEVQVAAYNKAENGKKAVLRTISGEELAFAYRSGCLEEGMAALGVTLRLAPGDAEKSLAEIREILASRNKSQPLEYPSAGSVFRNPEGSHAGYLIEQSGCKGMAVGGAQVSEKHGNFIINTGRATARDVLQLIDEVRRIVADKTGYVLETEVRLLGREM